MALIREVVRFMGTGINLFSDDGKSVLLPNITSESLQEQKSLMSEGIDKVISEKTISPLNIKEGTHIDKENYIFDYSRVQSIDIFEKNVLKSLLDKERGNVSIYLYNKSGKLSYIGKGERYQLARILPLFKGNIFSEDLMILVNYVVGSSDVQLVSSKDITKLRLKL